MGDGFWIEFLCASGERKQSREHGARKTPSDSHFSVSK
jgi:hypothetical protein